MAATSLLQLHHAESLEPLLDALAAVLSAPTTDPFAPEMVVVPTVGMADAAMAGLGKRLGICTNIEFVYPGRFLSRALGHTDHADTATDPWRLPQLGWAVLEALSADSTGVPGVTSNGVTWPLARHIADLFDRYATQRPQLIRDWAANIGKPNPVDTDGAGNVLDPDHRWQPKLWRAVRQLIGTPSGPELLPSLAERIAQGLVQPQLPARVFVFGVSSLQPTLLAVLEGLAASHEVHVFLEYPSSVVWQREAAVPASGLIPRDPSAMAATEVNHPLLASWGRPALATHALLRSHPAFQQRALPSPSVAPNTLLGSFQQALRTDNPALADPAPNPADGTLQIHACHGVTRQLEVLRDALGHCFLADPTLQPHEVIVLCPDLETFAPLIPAVFSRGSFPVPVRVGDRSLTSAEPVAQAVLQAAQLVVGRASLSGVIDLLQLEPVRRRFGLEHTDIENITEWCLELGTRWGLDTQHRTHAGLPTSIANGTWRATIDQLLAGVAMSAPSPRLVLGGTRPFDDLSTDETSVVGALADLLQVLLRLRDLIDHPASGFIERTVHEWCNDLHTVLDDLVSLPADQGWRIGQVHQAISAIADSASVNGSPCKVPFTFPAMLSLLESSLTERAGRVSLRSGAVTVTSMVPQHGVPARVICILGLDDSVLRIGAADGDDIIMQHLCLGERHPRSEQRQVLLDALLDATDRLIITCNGADLTTNAPVPLVVPIAELLDSLSALTGRHLRATGNPAQRGVPVVVHHKRHPFDESNFVAGALTTSVAGPFAFDTSMLEAALARRTGVQNTLATAVPPVLPTVSRSTVTLDDLVAAVATPAKVLLRDRLQVRLPERDDATIDDSLPLTVEHLTHSDLGRELLDTARQGTTALPWALQAALRVDLPPGNLANAAIDGANMEVGSILTKFAAVAGTTPSLGTTLPIDLVLQPGAGHRFADDTVLFGTVSGVVQHPTEPARRAITSLRFTKLRPSMRLGLAFQLAAATLTEPETTWEATLVCRAESVASRDRGKSDKYSQSSHLTLAGDTPELRAAAARRLLAMAAELAHQAYNTVVPYLDRCSHAIATGRKPTPIKNAFERDVAYDLYAQQFWNDHDELDFEPITRHLATEVWSTFSACIVEVTA